MKKVISILLLIIFLGAGITLEIKLNEYRTARTYSTEIIQQARKGRSVDFRKLKERNPDTKGWIYLNDTNIDCPIVQRDNDYYLHRDFDGNYLFDGTIFIDENNLHPFHEFNTVIYGHRMSSGAMFHDLKYYEEKEFFDAHKIIIIETPEQSYDLHVIAFCREDTDSKIYETQFEPVFYDAAQNQKAFTEADFVNLIKDKALILSDEPFSEEDNFVTLSTCVYSAGDERIQVIGILKEPREETVAIIKKENRPNYWIYAQIGVGLFMLLTTIFILKPRKKKNK